MLSALGHIFKAPFVDLSALWVLTPLVLIWCILEIYFSTHKREELGWNTALGNGISIFWIAVQLMQFLFSNKFDAFTWPKFAAVFFIMAYSMFISFISFRHSFSAKVTYAIASPTPVYYFAGISVLWAYGALIISLWVLLDLLLLFGVVLGIVGLLRKFMPESQKDDGTGTKNDIGSDFGGSGDDFSKGGDDFGKDDDFSDLKL